MTSGSLNGVKDDRTMNINSTNIVDLLEAKGLTWKVYAQGYPGNCFAGKSSGSYVRKHNPFISYDDIRTNPSRCANIVEAAEFDRDVKNGTLPNYVFYVPDLKNDGHDTGVAFANDWYEQNFSSLLNDANFMKDTIVISTFDESGASPKNQVYTSIVGGPVKVGSYSDALSHYSLLKMIEDNWSLGDLGREDATAWAVPAIWR
jgi:phospholipase C